METMIHRVVKQIPREKYQYFYLKYLLNSRNESTTNFSIFSRKNEKLLNNAQQQKLLLINQKRFYVKDHDENNQPKHCNKKSESECDGKAKKWPSGSKTQFDFHLETEAALNRQISTEFKAFYYYLSMFGYFGRVDVALPGCESFFLQMHHEEHGHALMLINYMKIRGGSVNLCAISPPPNQDWECPLNAFKVALDLEISVTDELRTADKIAQKHNDQSASDFLITNLLQDQMKSINEMAKFVSVLSGIGDHSLSRFIFDKDLLENHVSSKFNVLRDCENKNSSKND